MNLTIAKRQGSAKAVNCFITSQPTPALLTQIGYKIVCYPPENSGAMIGLDFGRRPIVIIGESICKAYLALLAHQTKRSKVSRQDITSEFTTFLLILVEPPAVCIADYLSTCYITPIFHL